MLGGRPLLCHTNVLAFRTPPSLSVCPDETNDLLQAMEAVGWAWCGFVGARSKQDQNHPDDGRLSSKLPSSVSSTTTTTMQPFSPVHWESQQKSSIAS